mmetsp:Transcript_51791/g.119035  ORF Transcript_51791/g.119035 Transcript_51791/m.119035 type:complete len:325 (-) Transcript_51791:205-1179(-)
MCILHRPRRCSAGQHSTYRKGDRRRGNTPFRTVVTPAWRQSHVISAYLQWRHIPTYNATTSTRMRASPAGRAVALRVSPATKRTQRVRECGERSGVPRSTVARLARRDLGEVSPRSGRDRRLTRRDLGEIRAHGHQHAEILARSRRDQVEIARTGVSMRCSSHSRSSEPACCFSRSGMATGGEGGRTSGRAFAALVGEVSASLGSGERSAEASTPTLLRSSSRWSEGPWASASSERPPSTRLGEMAVEGGRACASSGAAAKAIEKEKSTASAVDTPASMIEMLSCRHRAPRRTEISSSSSARCEGALRAVAPEHRLQGPSGRGG